MSRSKPDTQKAGRSKLIPFVPGEGYSKRHARRKDANGGRLEEVREWCASRGIFLDVKNEGHHWMFTKNGKMVEWWPSSAKLVANKDWDHGVHVHDFLQAFKFVASTLL